MTPFQLTRSVRSLNRLRRIAQTLTRHGFGHIVARVNLGRFVPVWMIRGSKRTAPIEEEPQSIGRRLAMVCADLGPTFIKLGQLLSTRPDILPPELLRELRALQDDVPPFDTNVAMSVIESDLGRPHDQCFETIDAAPLASGSIGQVYRARSLNGEDLVVKVQRPGIHQIIQLDMQLLAWLAESLENLMPEIAAYQPRMLVSELEQMLTRELDYVNEASTTQRFCEAFEGDEGIRIPHVYWNLSSTRVLTLEAIPGRNVDVLLRDAEGSIDRVNLTRVARRLAELYFKQVFDLGMFHADPHPGNLLIEPPDGLGLIDFGQVGIVTEEFMTELAIIIYASANRELDLAVDTMADMGAVGSGTDRRHLQRSLQVLIDKYDGLPLKRFDLNRLLEEFVETTRRHDIRIPQEMAQLIKAVGTVSGVIARLDPDFDVMEILAPKLKGVLARRLSPAKISRATALLGWDILSIIRKAPRQIRDLLRRASVGGWQLHVRHENIDRLISELDRSSNRLAFAIVIAAIIVGSSVVISAETALEPFGFPMQYIGIAGYVIAGILGLGLSWAIFRSGRLH